MLGVNSAREWWHNWNRDSSCAWWENVITIERYMRRQKFKTMKRWCHSIDFQQDSKWRLHSMELQQLCRTAYSIAYRKDDMFTIQVMQYALANWLTKGTWKSIFTLTSRVKHRVVFRSSLYWGDMDPHFYHWNMDQPFDEKINDHLAHFLLSIKQNKWLQQKNQTMT